MKAEWTDKEKVGEAIFYWVLIPELINQLFNQFCTDFQKYNKFYV